MKDNWDSNKYTTIADMQKNISNELLEQLRFNENDHVLDAGCGVGNLTFKVAEFVKKGHITGIDSSPSMIEKCNEKLKTKNISNIEFIVKNITEIDFINEFNVVFSNSVFHWIKEPKKALDVLYRSLKPGSCFGIQFPVLDSHHPMIAICEKTIKKLKLEEEFQNWDFPWYVPTLIDFKSLLEQYNFEEVKVYKKTADYHYGNSHNLYNSFDSAGLNMFTSILSEEKEIIFKSEIKKEIESLEDSNKLNIRFERLYAFGYNKLTNKIIEKTK